MKGQISPSNLLYGEFPPSHGQVRYTNDASTDQDLKSHDVEWFYRTPGHIPSGFRDLLEVYSRVPPEQVEEHLINARNQAWAINPMPCLGRFLFIELHLAQQEQLHKSIVERLKQGDRLLDLGCCIGQDMRKLVRDGAPAENLVGLDLDGRFFEVGYQLFRDRESKMGFVKANILEDSPQLKALESSFDIIHLDMFLHMLTWDQQLLAFKQAVKLVRPKPGSLLCGESAGHVHGIATESTWNAMTFRHNIATFKQLMRLVSEETDTQWDVKADLIAGSGRTSWVNQNSRRFIFQIERL